MRHVWLVVLYGLHCVMIQLTLELQLLVSLVVVVMVVDAGRGPRIRSRGHCRRLC